MRSWLNLIFVAIAAGGGYMAAVNNLKSAIPADLSSFLDGATYVELTHALEEGMPPGPGPEAPTIQILRSHEPGIGILPTGGSIHRYSFPGQWGTHIDAPIHFINNTRTIEEIRHDEMILPLVVIDIHEKVLENNDYQVTMEDIKVWEAEHGLVPEKTFVALRTDWSKRWPSLDKMRNRDKDGVSHSPGWSREVIDYLIKTRNITAIGHETLDTDPGVQAGSGTWPLQDYYMGLNHYQIENMRSLDQVPEFGAYIVASWSIPKNGDGFPARVYAIIPKEK